MNETRTESGHDTRPAPDENVWPGLSAPPAGLRATVSARVVDRLLRRAAGTLAVRIEYPDGTLVGGAVDDPAAPRMILRDPQAFARRVGRSGLIGFGESYMAGDWTSPDLSAVLTVFAQQMASLVPKPLQWLRALVLASRPSSENGTAENARTNVSRHYDLSNELFAAFLDDTMTYSSAVFGELDPPPRFDDLAAAQRAKIDRLLDAARVGPGSRVLEIGTGWGELCIRAAERGATVRSITLSSEQRELARERVAAAGYADSVQIDLLDYRSLDGSYDAVVSVEMIEAVGERYWRDYFRVIDDVLAPGGAVAIQAITMPHDRMLATRRTYTWVHKYIFPGGMLPSHRALDDVTRQHTSLRIVDTASLGPHYAETLRLWKTRFAAAADRVAALGFDDTFRRMWHFYLSYSEAGFRSGYIDVEQITFARTESE
ncbi:methyltransferase domain-containing protein [Rhodococcus rhodnii]|uniref:Cyclopropane-fatty-acyl-phospholipid synthase n=2 Tax=Rhodococcus rhodnii TaxID=38312 RepID=R7WNM6_9NOCA|nr:class I SAM-dependent methyltransferase [Rhodococcus rhodnii]EOM76916.1 cyclopropane-fatty-acyl-phospholipid synthase [Rhodococcus rhodnii LMG 5362]TXG89728.1 methyltransferase domain-containing protein [Rhodococcus rhodnii]